MFLIQYCRYGTETRHSFKIKSEISPEEAGSTNTASKTALETYKSSVFRQGDWNVAEPRSVRHSVTCNDFHIKPFSSKADGFEETKQQGEEEDQAESEEYPVNPRGTILNTMKRWCYILHNLYHCAYTENFQSIVFLIEVSAFFAFSSSLW